MTTIVYKDGILAADTRTSRTSYNSNFCCLSCGTPTERTVRDDAIKILYTKSKEKYLECVFRQEHIRAAGFAGNATWCTQMRHMLKNGEDIEKFNKNMKACLKYSEDNESDNPRGMMGTSIIVTENQVYLIRFNEYKAEKKVQIFPLDTKEVLAIGSGNSFAYAGAKFGQLTAQQAVALAGQCNEGTSLKVSFVNTLLDERTEELVDFSSELKVAFMP